MRRNCLTAIACTLVAATAAAPAPADHKRGHHYCQWAGVGDRGPDGTEYRNLHTYNLSCRKGFALMKAIERRHGPPSVGSYTSRVNGYRCKGRFQYHPEGVIYGGVSCRKGFRKAVWDGFTGNLGGGGGGP